MPSSERKLSKKGNPQTVYGEPKKKIKTGKANGADLSETTNIYAPVMDQIITWRGFQKTSSICLALIRFN